VRCRLVSLGEPGKQVWYVDLPFHLACTLNDDVDDLARGSLARSLSSFVCASPLSPANVDFDKYFEGTRPRKT
jgi:hypothetical protein